MALDIELKIYMPERLAVEQKAHRVVLPAEHMPLTVIRRRAPTLAALEAGEVKTLDENNNPVEIWLISGGAADIKEDTCAILTEAVFNKKELNLEKARALYEEFANPFYEWLVSYYEKENKAK